MRRCNFGGENMAVLCLQPNEGCENTSGVRIDIEFVDDAMPDSGRVHFLRSLVEQLDENVFLPGSVVSFENKL